MNTQTPTPKTILIAKKLYTILREWKQGKIDPSSTQQALMSNILEIAKLERELAEKDAQIVEVREQLVWQNMPNRREPTRGGHEFYINEEWRGICSAALDDSVSGVASLMKVRFDPDDERVRVRRVLDDDAILSDLKKANAQIAALRRIAEMAQKLPTCQGCPVENHELVVAATEALKTKS